MSIRKKTLIIVMLTFLILMGTIILTAWLFVLGGFSDLEVQESRLNVKRGINELQCILSNLNAAAGDWVSWSETSNFVGTHNQDFTKENLVDSVLVNLRLNFMVFIDSSGQIVFSKFVDLVKEKEIPAPSDLLDKILSNPELVQHTSTEASQTGIIMTLTAPAFIASRPILKSDYSGPIRGALVIGRYLDALEIKRVSEILQLSVSVYPFDDPLMPPDFKEARPALSKEEQIIVKPLSIDSIAGYTLQKDVHGKSAFMMKVQMPRKIYQHGRTTLLYYIFSLLAIGLLFIALVMLFLEKVVLSPLNWLSGQVSEIGKTADLSKILPVSRKDELGVLAEEINGMLKQLGEKTTELEKANDQLRNDIVKRKQAEEALKESEARYRALFQGAAEGILVADIETRKFIYANPAICRILGYSEEELKQMGVSDIHPEEDLEHVISEFEAQARGEKTLAQDIPCLRKDGEIIYADITTSKVFIDGRECNVGLFTDITKEKKLEAQLAQAQRMESIGTLA